MAALRTLGVLFLTVPTAVAFSSGGGSGLDDNGLPYLQPCDALTLCEPACPPGMTAVGPPERSEVYRFGTADGTTSYVPGQLLTMSLNLTARTIVGKRDAGTRLVGNETAKYLGLLLVAVDKREIKVGTWKIALDDSPRFWLPPDPGCGGRALMHADAELKGFSERFVFEAPPAGTGPITFRVLVKQGETNKGAFYWPATVDTTGSAVQLPSFGVAGGDLTLSEAAEGADGVDGDGVQWLSAASRAIEWAGPQACSAVCAAQGLTCDEAALLHASSESRLLGQVEHQFLCVPPLLAGCDGAPRMSGLGDGFCWYRDDECAAEASLCDAVPQDADYATSIRLCACAGGGGGRRSRRLHLGAAATDAALGGRAAANAAAHAQAAEALRAAAERGAEKVAAAGGCPAARLALQRKNAGGEDNLLLSAAACPKARSLAIAALGGLVSETADEAYALDANRAGADAHHAAADAHHAAADTHQAAADARTATSRTLGAGWWGLGALVGGLAVAIGRRPMGRQGERRIGARAVLGLLVGSHCPKPVAAHNWMVYPQRGSGAQQTCAPRMNLDPHHRLNRGQPFNIMWSSGHGGPVWIVLVHAKDEDKIKLTRTTSIMAQYLMEAPPSAKARYTGPYWDKYHCARTARSRPLGLPTPHPEPA